MAAQVHKIFQRQTLVAGLAELVDVVGIDAVVPQSDELVERQTLVADTGQLTETDRS
jgi:hypothetical protein